MITLFIFKHNNAGRLNKRLKHEWINEMDYQMYVYTI